jgi:hypothetical protein
MATRARREAKLSENDDAGRILLVAMPLRHLEAAREIADQAGSVVLPAGGPGDLDATALGTHVLVIVTEPGDARVPAATWSAAFGGRVDHDAGDPWPEGLPPTWLDEHGHRGERDDATPRPEKPHDAADADDDEEKDDEADVVGPQSFFRVSGLRPLPQSEWVFANELVPKQRRRGRTFVPRVPVLVAAPG